MESLEKKKFIKISLVLVIVWALTLQFFYWPKHDEWEIGFPKAIFNTLKNI
jgi:hypothetical protein